MVQVKVEQGILEGETVKGVLGGYYHSFKGIPYAEPPIGDLRFRAPRPPKCWSGIRKAKEHGPVCFQFDVFSRTIVEGSEDCLYLNVYSPNIASSNKLPVMFWIHGGSYMSGSGNDTFYGPDFLVDHNIVLVTINYRLEVLGFLCLETEDIPGNAGMKDQVAALRWVNKNIDKFGGDPNNVTIFGESAGASAVSYHLISPMTKGLFKRAIVQSGSCNCQWAQAFEPRQRALELARELGSDAKRDKELTAFLKSLPVETLVKRKTSILMAETLQTNINLYFTVVNEKIFVGNEHFFSGDIINCLKQGIHERVDVITGYTDDEGYLGLIKNPIDEILNKFNKYTECFVSMRFVYNLPITKQIQIGTKIKEFYYKQSNVTEDSLEGVVKYFSMSSFNFDIMQWVKLCGNRNKNKVYLYKFGYNSERNILSEILGANKNILKRPKVCHGDDLMYLFPVKVGNLPLDMNSIAFKYIKEITTLWTNFAKYGDPTYKLNVVWEPYTIQNQNFLSIGEELKMKVFPDKEEFDFWESIYQEYLPRYLAIEK